MKVLIVASYNKNHYAPFIKEQAVALEELRCKIEWFGLQGKGMLGYLKNLSALKKKISETHPDVVHAHYGLSGLLANLQRHVPVVTTYHGSDINDNKAIRFSKVAMKLSAWNIFVSRKTLDIARPKKHYSLLPCGIDLCEAQLTGKSVARQKMKLDEKKKYVLFAGAFDNVVKNSPLAKEAVLLMQDDNVELLELKGYSREEVVLLMCAADVFLMTSFSEGSPQVVKEAMACGCPIVSVDVGDVKERVDGVEACYVSETREPQALAELMKKAMSFEGRTSGREKILIEGLDNRYVAKQLMAIYEQVMNLL